MTQSHIRQDSFSSTPSKIIDLGDLSAVAAQKYGSKSIKIQDFHKATLMVKVAVVSGTVDTLNLGWEASMDGVFGDENVYPLRLLDPTSSSLSLITSLEAINAAAYYVIPLPFDLVIPYFRLTATGVGSASAGYTVSSKLVLQKMYR